MPDQYTLAALQRLEFARPGAGKSGPERQARPPVLATLALISSHAPWTPIPPGIDWADVGDGSAFGRYAAAGDPPAVVWRATGRVRKQYARSLARSEERRVGTARLSQCTSRWSRVPQKQKTKNE